MSIQFEQCPDCGGRGYDEYRPTCQLCGVIETEPHEHPVERIVCRTCHGVGTLYWLLPCARLAVVRLRLPTHTVSRERRRYAAEGCTWPVATNI
jgi:hypothetical protein